MLYVKNNPLIRGLFFVLEFASFVNDARKFVDNILTVDGTRVSNAYER